MRDSRSEPFRNYSFVAQNLRDPARKHYLKDESLGLYEKDIRLRRLVDEGVKELTPSLIDGLNFKNNIAQMAPSPRAFSIQATWASRRQRLDTSEKGNNRNMLCYRSLLTNLILFLAAVSGSGYGAISKPT